MRFLEYLSLRKRFLVAPLLGILLAIALFGISNQTIRYHSTLLEQLHDANLPQVSRIGQLTVLLANNHSRLTNTLVEAITHGDEEQVYLESRESLFTLHDIEEQLNEDINVRAALSADGQLEAATLQTFFALYREAAISAIELSTVDAARAKLELINADRGLYLLNQTLLRFSEQHIEALTNGSQLIEDTLFDDERVMLLSAALIALMILSAMFFSRRLTSDIDRINGKLAELASGNTRVELEHHPRHYLRSLSKVAHVFRDTLLDNARQRDELQQAVDQLRDSEQRISSLLDITATAIVVIDEQHNIVIFNQSAERMFGYSQDIIGRPLRMLIPQRFHADHDQHIDAFDGSGVQAMVSNERPAVTAIKRDGSEFPVEVSISKLHLKDRIYMTAALTDISERVEQDKIILRQAHYDNLTDLPNRFLSLDRLSQLIKKASRKQDQVAVMFLDLDDFKKINDTLGHQAGDQLLEESARRLQSIVRNEDTVGRLGGDEFILVAGGLQHPIDAQLIAINLLDKFKQPFKVNDRELRMTTSIGIALYPDDGTEPNELLRNADAAMYFSKEQGRNTYAFFTREMNREALRRLEIEEQMHGAIERQEFTVAFQPTIDLQTDQLAGCEALLRWNNPSLGHVSPAEFIPVAEQSGYIVELGEFVLEQAAAMLSECKSQYTERFCMAVNLSPRQLRDLSLINKMALTVRQHKLNNADIELEITEGVLLSGQKSVRQTLEDLDGMGFRLAMDDFGTGYSSLSYLRNYPFDTLKIDRVFIRDIDNNEADLKLVKAAIEMAHGLGLRVTAEGIENDGQHRLVKSLGCDIGQGFYYGKPVERNSFLSNIHLDRSKNISG